MGSITITGSHASPDRPSFSRGTTGSFSRTLLRRWHGSDRVQNLHRGEHEFAGPQLPWLSARQYAIFFFADHKGNGVIEGCYLRNFFTHVLTRAPEDARLVIRIGGRRLENRDLRIRLVKSLKHGLGREVRLLDDSVTSKVSNTQANTFRGARASPVEEHDFHFAV